MNAPHRTHGDHFWCKIATIGLWNATGWRMWWIERLWDTFEHYFHVSTSTGVPTLNWKKFTYMQMTENIRWLVSWEYFDGSVQNSQVITGHISEQPDNIVLGINKNRFTKKKEITNGQIMSLLRWILLFPFQSITIYTMWKTLDFNWPIGPG